MIMFISIYVYLFVFDSRVCIFDHDLFFFLYIVVQFVHKIRKIYEIDVEFLFY
jgi:hypothetical protein